VAETKSHPPSLLNWGDELILKSAWSPFTPMRPEIGAGVPKQKLPFLCRKNPTKEGRFESVLVWRNKLNAVVPLFGLRLGLMDEFGRSVRPWPSP
jgi:hypothetical protein